MLIQLLPTALVAAVTLAGVVHAKPALEARAVTPSSSTLWQWAHDDIQCKTDACTSDCQAATAKLCAIPNLSTTQSVTVGGCTAFYWYDAHNTLPSAAQCNAAFGQITGPVSKAGSATDCPGFVGGALGYDSNNKRTNDPVYIVHPKAGNGNCLKAPGDTTPVLAIDELPDGKSLSTCPVSSIRRKRAFAELEDREINTKCVLEDAFVGGGCSSTCLLSVTAAAWETGPFVAAGWVACIGVCATAGAKTYTTCKKQLDSQSQNPKRDIGGGGANPCLNIQLYSWPCQQMENDVLAAKKCVANADSTTNPNSENGSVNYV